MATVTRDPVRSVLPVEAWPPSVALSNYALGYVDTVRARRRCPSTWRRCTAARFLRRPRRPVVGGETPEALVDRLAPAYPEWEPDALYAALASSRRSEDLLRRPALGVGRPQPAAIARGHGPRAGALRLPRLARRRRPRPGSASASRAPTSACSQRFARLHASRRRRSVLRLLLQLGGLPRDDRRASASRGCRRSTSRATTCTSSTWSATSRRASTCASCPSSPRMADFRSRRRRPRCAFSSRRIRGVSSVPEPRHVRRDVRRPALRRPSRVSRPPLPPRRAPCAPGAPAGRRASGSTWRTPEPRPGADRGRTPGRHSPHLSRAPACCRRATGLLGQRRDGQHATVDTSAPTAARDCCSLTWSRTFRQSRLSLGFATAGSSHLSEQAPDPSAPARIRGADVRRAVPDRRPARAGRVLRASARSSDLRRPGRSARQGALLPGAPGAVRAHSPRRSSTRAAEHTWQHRFRELFGALGLRARPMSAAEERLANDPDLGAVGRAPQPLPLRGASSRSAGQTVLDVACGAGFGLDMLRQGGRRARSASTTTPGRCARFGTPSRARACVRGDATCLPLKDASIDLVGVLRDDRARARRPGTGARDPPRARTRADVWSCRRRIAPSVRPSGTRATRSTSASSPPPSCTTCCASSFDEVAALRPAPVGCVSLRAVSDAGAATTRRPPWPGSCSCACRSASRNRVALALSGRPFYPGEDDYRFVPDDGDGAHALVAVAT